MTELRSREKPLRDHSITKCEEVKSEEDQREIENPRIVKPGAQGVCTLLGVDLLVLFAEAVRVGHDGALFRRLEIPEDHGHDDQQHQARDQVEARKDSFADKATPRPVTFSTTFSTDPLRGTGNAIEPDRPSVETTNPV